MMAKTVSFAFAIALPLLLVRRLSQQDLGLYKQAFFVVTTAMNLLPLGFALSAFYFLPREPARQPAVIANILAFLAGMGGCAAVLLLDLAGLHRLAVRHAGAGPAGPPARRRRAAVDDRIVPRAHHRRGAGRAGVHRVHRAGAVQQDGAAHGRGRPRRHGAGAGRRRPVPGRGADHRHGALPAPPVPGVLARLRLAAAAPPGCLRAAARDVVARHPAAGHLPPPVRQQRLRTGRLRHLLGRRDAAAARRHPARIGRRGDAAAHQPARERERPAPDPRPGRARRAQAGAGLLPALGVPPRRRSRGRHLPVHPAVRGELADLRHRRVDPADERDRARPRDARAQRALLLPRASA